MHFRLLTDDFLRVLREDGKADPNVWAIGDAARMESLALPATAQGEYLRPRTLQDTRTPWRLHTHWY